MSLPKGWKSARFGEIFDCQQKTKIKAGEGLDSGKYKFFTSSDEQKKFIDSYKFEGEHLILGTGGVASIHYCNEKFATSTDCFVLKLKTKDIILKFIYYFFKSRFYLLEEGFRGAGLKHLSRHYLNNISIPFPENKEIQKKIVSILEKAESLKASREEADRLTDELLKSVFYEMFGDPVRNEKKWEKKKLLDFGIWRSGGTPSRRNPNYFNGVIPWYNSGELNSIYISESLEKISDIAIEESAAKLIKPDTLLLGMYDTAALKSSITTRICACNQAIAFSELEKKNIDIIYLYYTLQLGRKYFMSQQRGVRQKNLNLDMIKNLQVPVPPIVNQKKFSKIAQSIHHLKTLQNISRSNIEHLLNSIIQKAFNGELI